MVTRARADAPFGKMLTGLMREREMSVREAARIAGVSHSTIIDWQTGASPDNYMAVKRLAKALHVSLCFLLTGADDDLTTQDGLAVHAALEDGDFLFDGYAKVTIQRLLPRVGRPHKTKRE